MPQLVRVGQGMGAARAPEVPSWVTRLDGRAPVAGWNFVTGQSYGLAATDAFTGLVITGAGLTINTGTNVNATAALIAKFSGDFTVIAKLAGRAGASNAGILAYNNTTGEAPLYNVAGGLLRAFHTNTAGSLDDPNKRLNGPPRYVGVSQGATAGRSVCMNGNTVSTKSNATNHPVPSSVQLGRYNNTDYLNDDIAWMFIYNFKCTDSALQDATQEPARPFSGTQPYLRGMDQNYVDFGINVPKVTLEYTQPWSCLAAVRIAAKPDVSGTYLGDMIFTNVSANADPFLGYEFWVNSNGQLHVRIINTVGGGTPKFIGVRGTVDRSNGSNIALVGASYSGNGLASGVKIYFNGSAETTAVESDTLGGSTIVGGSQHFMILNQFNRFGYKWLGDMAFMCLTNDVKDAAWFASHADMNSLPAVDASMLLYPDIANMAAGTTVTDLSASPANGTATTAKMRMAA